MKIFLGIDFGTTQTVVTMIKEGSTYEPEVVEIDGKKTVDTVLCIDAEDNVVFFGSDALDRIHDAPEDTFYNFKVTIGSGKIFRSSHKDYRPETLALLFLKHLRQKIEKNYFNVADLAEQEDLHCTIGCPAAWNERQRQAVINLAQKAGFPNVSCCDEPLSVIYYYHSRGEISLTKPQNILVYDFGGGTTDVALEEISPDANGCPCKNPRVLAVSGMSNLGGRD
ncbi:MAG: Hsp70 family protein, partial [Synergistaceae bacterium]|nr:Hsp70 family protein [Synergistaceae bacterium]